MKTALMFKSILALTAILVPEAFGQCRMYGPPIVYGQPPPVYIQPTQPAPPQVVPGAEEFKAKAKKATAKVEDLKKQLEEKKEAIAKAAKEAEKEVSDLEAEIVTAEKAAKRAEKFAAAANAKPPTNNTTVLVITLPEEAKLAIDGKDLPAQDDSPVRIYNTPVLRPGQFYFFMVRCTVSGTTTTRKVQFGANEVVRIDFTK
jgi:uncharacterized protein (TIGR03000 family)